MAIYLTHFTIILIFCLEATLYHSTMSLQKLYDVFSIAMPMKYLMYKKAREMEWVCIAIYQFPEFL